MALPNEITRYRFRQEVDIPSATYLTHGMHSYPARFIPHIPHWVLRRYGRPGDVVLDPFAGSGTALLEALLYGQPGIGVDLNPLSPLLIAAKTDVPASMRAFSRDARLAAQSAARSPQTFEPRWRNLGKWFQPPARNALARIFGYLHHNPDDLPDNLRTFLRVAASSAVRTVSNADPRVAKPFISRHRRTDIVAGRVPQDAQAVFEQRVERFLRRKRAWVRAMRAAMAHYGLAAPPGVTFAGDDARAMTAVADDSVDIVVTSPPYANAQEYFRTVKLELLWLGVVDVPGLLRLNNRLIGTERIGLADFDTRTPAAQPEIDAVLAAIYERDAKRAEVLRRYFDDMGCALRETHRVLRPGGTFALLSGDNRVRDVPVPTHRFLHTLAEDAGFQTVDIGYDEIYVRALSPQRSRSAGLIDGEWLLTFRKP